jgi:CRISPR-associated protein Cas8b/Csh1 subtype I-B
MIQAFRSLGILKMIEKFPGEFSPEALSSVESFLDMREKAIEKGVYGELQFEKINSEKIGIFELKDDKITFQEEEVEPEDSWKYLFLKTAPQGTYITPTWKESSSKLKKTIDKYAEDLEKENSEWLQNVLKIFNSSEVEIRELNEEGSLNKKSFLETVEWAKKTRGLSIFSVKLNGKYNAEIKELLNLALTNKPKTIYQTEQSKSFNKLGIKCSLCNSQGELFPNVLSGGTGINIGNVDKPGFFPGVDGENAEKAFPICGPCAETLYAARFHVFHSSSKLRQNLGGHQTIVLPHIVQGKNKVEELEIVKSGLGLLKGGLSGAQRTESNVITDLSETKGISTVTFIIGDVAGQNIEDIRKIIPDVLPSRLTEVSEAIKKANRINEGYTNNHPWKSRENPLDGNLMIIKDVLGMPKYIKPSKGKRKPFKSSTVDSLDILEAILLKKEYPLKDILSEFSSKLSYDFLGALSNDDKNKPFYVLKDNVTNMVYFLSFLNFLKVIQMKPNNNFVGKYLGQYEGLKPLDDFLTNEANGLDTKEKEYAFLVGLLLGKLVSIQQARGVSTGALKWLKGLQMSPSDLTEIFLNIRRKLDDYSTPKSAWSEEMRGVAEAISALGSDISSWNISRKEIPYYLSLGQSLSSYYLPSKSKDNESTKEVKK